MKAEQIPVICLMGPTATGKTDAAAFLYNHLDAQIISVDSSLVYQGMNIGTAKPDANFLAKFPHHLVDIRHPNDTYSVADFYTDSISLINEITAQGQVPILVGGTHFYFKAIADGLSDLPAADKELRQQINQSANRHGWEVMHQRLAALDPERASNIDTLDAQRIQRALEIVISSGQTVATLNQHKKPPLKNPLINLALVFSDRSQLHQRIEQRFDLMLDQGLQQEVETLLNQGVDRHSTAMRMIGYRQMLDFIEAKITHNEMRNQAIASTRQLAKRQLTWLRNQANTVWWVDHGLIEKDYSLIWILINQYFNDKKIK